MRIFLLSDIPSTRFSSVRQIVSRTRPSLILVAGDLVDDDKSVEGSPEKWRALYKLMGFFNKSGVQTYFVRGNWDENKHYDRLVDLTEDLPCVEEISGRVVEFKGIRILGVPYSFTSRLKTAKRISQRFPEPVDIVLAHAELARRIWLFDLNTKFIVTGHFDTQLCQIGNRIFISLDSNTPPSYAILDHTMDRQSIAYVEGAFAREGEGRVSNARVVDGQLLWDTQPLASSVANGKYRCYATWVEALISTREQIQTGTKKRREASFELQRRGIPKKHVREYIGDG